MCKINIVKKIRRTIDISEELLQGLSILAAANGTKVKAVMEIALQKYVDDNLDKDIFNKIQNIGKSHE